MCVRLVSIQINLLAANTMKKIHVLTLTSLALLTACGKNETTSAPSVSPAIGTVTTTATTSSAPQASVQSLPTTLPVAQQVSVNTATSPNPHSVPAPTANSLPMPPAGLSGVPHPGQPVQQQNQPYQANPHATPNAALYQNQPAPVTPALVPALAPATARTNFMGVEVSIPSNWGRVPPTSSMRLAQFQIPAPSASEAGEAVVFYFPPGRGGPKEENIARWTSQFSLPDGQPVKPQIKSQKIDGLDVTLVELNGNYARGVSMGQQEATVRPNQTLLAAIVMTQDGRNITFHLFGPKATVAGQRKAFDNMIKGLKFGG